MSHTGKLKKLIEGIPEMQVEQDGSEYFASWISNESDDKKVVDDHMENQKSASAAKHDINLYNKT
jgi:predicted secreted protein